MDNKNNVPTPEQLAAWKTKHGATFTFKTDKGEVVLAKPDRLTLKLILNKLKTDSLAAAETLIKSCWLHGDELLKEDDGFILSVFNKFDEIVGIVSYDMKKN
jgi:hypothetical protein